MNKSQSPQAEDGTGGQRLTLFQRIALALKAKPPGAQWDPKVKFFETRLRLYLLLVLVAAFTALVIAWTLTQPIVPAEVRPLAVGVNLTVMLAPVLAAATGVERFLETLFGIIEGNWRTLVAYLGRGLRWLQNAEAEVESARSWLAKVSGEYNRELAQLPQLPTASAATPPSAPPEEAAFAVQGEQAGAVQPSPAEEFFLLAKAKLDDAKKLMDLAKQRLQAAENALNDVTASDSYRNAKRAASIYLGLVLGLFVATASSMQMFALMGVKVGNPRIDVIVTGLVIGSGSTPVHSLINILQSAKDTLDSAQGWLDSAKKKPAAQEQGQ
jgi:hypothetical protein